MSVHSNTLINPVSNKTTQRAWACFMLMYQHAYTVCTYVLVCMHLLRDKQHLWIQEQGFTQRMCVCVCQTVHLQMCLCVCVSVCVHTWMCGCVFMLVACVGVCVWVCV